MYIRLTTPLRVQGFVMEIKSHLLELQNKVDQVNGLVQKTTGDHYEEWQKQRE